jgi:hypothetical protein
VRLNPATENLVLKTVLLVLVFITAMYTKEYEGEYEQVIHSHVGGTLYVLFGGLLFSVLLPRKSVWLHVSAAFSITCLLECVQWFRIPFLVDLTSRSRVAAYIFGNSYNPLDFIYYLAGAALAVLVLILLTEPKPEN